MMISNSNNSTSNASNYVVHNAYEIHNKTLICKIIQTDLSTHECGIGFKCTTLCTSLDIHMILSELVDTCDYFGYSLTDESNGLAIMTEYTPMMDSNKLSKFLSYYLDDASYTAWVYKISNIE